MPKTVYLTLDDAPSPAMRHKVDYLSSRGIPAVFFCQGDRLEARPDQAVHAIRKGFIIGNHAYDHPSFSDLPLVACYEQIRRADRIVDSLYSAAGVRRAHWFFRFPYGDKGGLRGDDVFGPYGAEGAARKAAIQAFLRQCGYSQPRFEGVRYAYYRAAGLLDDVDWHWTYDVMEWTIYEDEHQFGIDSLARVFARMEEDVPEGCRGLNHPGSDDIVLIHEWQESDELFEPIMDHLLAKGVNFGPPPA